MILAAGLSEIYMKKKFNRKPRLYSIFNTKNVSIC